MGVSTTDINSLVELIPIEFELRRGKTQNPRIRRYFDIRFADALSPERIEWILTRLKSKKRIKTEFIANRYILWHYGTTKPPLLLDLLERNLKTSLEVIHKYGEIRCMHQASIIMRILRRFELVSYRRTTFTLNFNRIGRTERERSITYRGIELAAESLKYK